MNCSKSEMRAEVSLEENEMLRHGAPPLDDDDRNFADDLAEVRQDFGRLGQTILNFKIVWPKSWPSGQDAPIPLNFKPQNSLGAGQFDTAWNLHITNEFLLQFGMFV